MGAGDSLRVPGYVTAQRIADALDLPGAINVKFFGAKGDGVTNDAPAIQAAIDSLGSSAGTIFFPRGDYYITSSIKVSLTGTILEGESAASTYLRTPDGSSFDILKIAGAFSEVRGLQFRPGGNQVCIRVYAAHCTIERNRFLADANNVGTAIVLTDTDPDTLSFIAGAYTHTIYNNLIGTSGYAFRYGIDDASASGTTSTKFIANQILSDTPIRMSTGGGNTYIGNLLQSSTGTTMTPAGIGLDIGTAVIGEMIYGNYFEKFAQGTLLRRLVDTDVGAVVNGNHYDNCTSNLVSSGIANYIYEDTQYNYRQAYGWQVESIAATQKFYAPNGTTVVEMDTSGRASFGKPLKLKSYTVATLPSGAFGDLACVTDASSPTYLGVLTGGGAIKTLAFYDGTNWIALSGPSGGGGVTDHGALTGLGDDDHSQYHNDARGDARYYTQSQVDTALGGKSNTGHTHTASNITDFSEAVDDRVGALLVAGTNISLSYNDAANSLTINSPSELVKGQVTVTIPSTLFAGECEHEETVSATGVTSSMTVIPSLAPHLDTDENHEELLDVLALTATPGTDQITFRLAFSSFTSGPVKLNYMAT